VKASTAAASSVATVSPSNVVEGNCGFSYVYEYGVGNRSVELYTGYSVVSDVIAWSWQVRLDDRGGSSYKNWLGHTNLGTWQTVTIVSGLSIGPARATVIPANSYAILDTGVACMSLGPFATTTIT